MELVDKYLGKHDKKVRTKFKQVSKSDKLEATKIFSFFQNAFSQQQFRFQVNGVDFFKEEENEPVMEKLIESYYRISQGDESKKFYMYRIQFDYEQIRDIIAFWLQRQPQLKIVYIQEGSSLVARGTVGIGPEDGKGNQNEIQIEKNDSGLIEDNDQFQMNGQKIARLMEESKKHIEEQQSKLEKAQDEQEKNTIKNKIKDLTMKMKVLEQQSKTNGDTKKTNKVQDTKANKMGESDNSSQNVDFASISKKVKINYRAIFDFYAKQTHLTGVKATFERIELQSQTINYQKLVHFLREFDLLPESVPDRKKVHGLYIKNCESSRVLSLQGFLSVLDGVVNILCPDKTKQERSQILKQKIYMKNSKNNKILNHPFHSLEKQDFRINVNQLTYSFKIKPQDGKFIHQVNNSIEKRRKDKEEAKNDRLKEREIVKIRYLKKLQSIDPFNPLLAKNKSILEAKPQQQDPVASFDNMEKYRDASFNFQGHFGIDLSHEIFDSPVKSSRRVASEMKRESSERYSKGEEAQKRVEKLERYETAKMESLMSGIIERTNAKIQKFGVSPQKLGKSVKFAQQ